jgi:hypothetical protein
VVNALMGAGSIVINGVFHDQPLYLSAMSNEHMIQAFPLQTTNDPLANRIGLGHLKRGS